MKPTLFLFASLIFVLKINAQIMWEVRFDTVIKWNYKEGDEFNSDNINTDYWNYSYGWARTIYNNKEQQYYTEGKNHFQKNGTLKLTAKKEKIFARIIDQYGDNDTIKKDNKFYSLNKSNFNYSAGMIQTKKQFPKGYFECRVKLPKQPGYWPAFWLYGGSPNEEIDMLEGKTEKKEQIHIDTHCSNHCDLVKLFFGKKSYGGWVKTKYNFTEEFNIIACDWDNNQIKFYLNGQCIGVSKVNFNENKNLVFNIAVPSDDGPFKPGPSKSDSSNAVFEIDYVRVWSKELIGDQKSKQIVNSPLITNVENGRNIAISSMSKSKSKLTYGKKSDHENESVFISCFDNQTNLQIFSLGVFDQGKPIYSITNASGKEFYTGNLDTQIFNFEKSLLKSGNYTINIKVKGKTLATNFIVN